MFENISLTSVKQVQKCRIFMFKKEKNYFTSFEFQTTIIKPVFQTRIWLILI